jgi:hypothetical protein
MSLTSDLDPALATLLNNGNLRLMEAPGARGVGRPPRGSANGFDGALRVVGVQFVDPEMVGRHDERLAGHR